MSVDQVRQAMNARIWQAVASSGVNVSAIPKVDLEKLVDAISQEVLLEVDTLLGQTTVVPELQDIIRAVPEGEKVLWEGRPFLSLVERYTVTSERLRILTGLVGRGHEDIELVRVKDVDWQQGVGDRIFGIGDVFLDTADATRPQAVLRNVQHPEVVHEILRRAVIEVRKKYHIIFEQEL
jgi:hypothetical protein